MEYIIRKILVENRLARNSLLVVLIVHFSSIVLTRTSLYDNEIMKSILSFSWPSILYTIDILSWNLIYGIACLYVGVCTRKKYSNSIGTLTIISGILCLIGFIALPLNNMNFRLIGVFGYSIIPVVIGVLVFNKELGASYKKRPIETLSIETRYICGK